MRYRFLDAPPVLPLGYRIKEAQSPCLGSVRNNYRARHPTLGLVHREDYIMKTTKCLGWTRYEWRWAEVVVWRNQRIGFTLVLSMTGIHRILFRIGWHKFDVRLGNMD